MSRERGERAGASLAHLFQSFQDERYRVFMVSLSTTPSAEVQPGSRMWRCALVVRGGLLLDVWA